MKNFKILLTLLIFVYPVIMIMGVNPGQYSGYINVCYAQEPEQVKETLFREIGDLFDRAKNEEVPVYSPEAFAKAEQVYREALQRMERGEPLDNIYGLLYRAKAYLEEAIEFARNVKVPLEEVVAWREEAQRTAGFEPSRELLDRAEGSFNRAILTAKRGDIRGAKERAEEAKADYQAVLMLYYREGVLNQAKIELEESADRMTAEEYKASLLKLEQAGSFLQRATAEGLFLREFPNLVEGINWGTKAGTAYPDLTVELYDIPYSPIKGIYPFPPLTDRPATLSVLVSNSGLLAVESRFEIELYVDGALSKTWTFLPISPDEDPLHARSPLLPGGTRIYDHQVTFHTSGYHTLRWAVDAKNGIQESNENNNVLDTTVFWQAPPDLIVEDIWPVGDLVGGQKTTWRVRIRNTGSGAVSIPFLTTFWPEGIAGGVQENFWSQSALTPGQPLTFQTGQSFRSWGKLKISATVDVGNYIPEALPNGENNNEMVKSFDLAPVDLKVNNLVVSPAMPSTCDPVTFSFTVSNIGNGNANQPFKIKVMPGKQSGGLIQPIFLTLNGLTAGQSVSMQHTMKLPPGNHQITIEADFSDPATGPAYFEPNRNNNVVFTTIQVDGPYDGLSMCLGESIYINPANPADVGRDRDGDMLKDDLEGKLANGFRPYFKFDDAEKTRRSIEPVTLFQVRPKGCSGSGCTGQTEIWIRWTFLFMWDGGYGPDSWEHIDSHKGDNDKALYKLTSSDGGFTWKLVTVYLGGGNNGFEWPQGYPKPAYLGSRVVPVLKTANVQWYQQHHPTIFMSAHKHHMYFDTAYDHHDSFYSKWRWNDDVNGKGAAFISDLHSVFQDYRYNNVGEPNSHPADYFVNCLLQFPATTLGRVVDTGNPECYNFDNQKGYFYSAWGTSHFFKVSGNSQIWLTVKECKFWLK